MDHLAKECCKIAHHTTCQPLELSCCFAATSVLDDWQEYSCRLHLSGACKYPADDLPSGSSTAEMLHQCNGEP
jgi:hypothetical protein